MSGTFRARIDYIRTSLSDNPARLIDLTRILLAFTAAAVIAVVSTSGAPRWNGALALLLAYAIYAIGAALVGARSWWLEAKLSPFSYLVDAGIFLAMLLMTDAYGGLFFALFLLLLVSSRYRIGWGRTVVAGLGLGVGLLVLVVQMRIVAGEPGAIDLERLILRLVSLAILTLLIALFYGEPGGDIPLDNWHDALLRDVMRENELPLPLILDRVRSLFGADRMVYAWRDKATARLRMIVHEQGELGERDCTAGDFSLLLRTGIDQNQSFLFDGIRGRVLSRDLRGRKVPLQVSPFAKFLNPPLTEGVCIPIDCQAAMGRLFIIRDGGATEGDLRRADPAGSAIDAALDRYHLVHAIRDSAFSKARLAMARNIHDSVLQSLAGLGMRFGAMKLDLKAGRVEETMSELDKLQSLVKDEQLGLRAMMRGEQDAAEESCNVIPILREIADALAEQWKINCAVSAFPDPIMIPVRLGTEVRFLVREAVANAARHAKASWVRISVALHDDSIKLVVTSDRNIEVPDDRALMPRAPRSLSERAEGLGGSVTLQQKPTGTHLTVFLPRRGK
jgi:signal transduction histidine kinase